MDKSSTLPRKRTPKQPYSRVEYPKYARTQGLNLSWFIKRAYAFIRLMAETGAYVDVAYKGTILRIHIENLNIPHKREYRPRLKKAEKVKAGSCPACKKILIEGVCFNALCPSRQPQDDANQGDQPDNG